MTGVLALAMFGLACFGLGFAVAKVSTILKDSRRRGG